MHQQVNLDRLQRFDPLALSPLVEDRDSLYYSIKRALDFTLAVLFLVILSPLMALIAVMIVLDSGWPIIFSQVRVGSKRWVQDGFSYWQRRDFTCYKFRTMFQDADEAIHKTYIKSFVEGNVEPSDNKEVKYKLCDDCRVTRIGRLLRITSLDELPQFVNILRGEMSLVGPRPDVPYAVQDYKSWHYERLTALPGLTGLWQITARSSVSFDEMARLDIEYARNQSLLLDLKILVLTIPAVLSAKGAV
jgi:lipopolysaccharide/colanic/teichoic acid biosynthesis glycosyltransferase